MTEKQVYEKTFELFDGLCAICKDSNIAMHHIRYGGLYGGRKTYLGNIIPLCPKHHALVHTNKKKYMDQLIEIIDERLKKEEKWKDG